MVDTERLMRTLVPAVSTNVGGFAFQYVDPMVSPVFSSLGSNAKWGKVAVYTALGVLADYFTEGRGETAEMAGNVAADFLYGLSAGTAAADPVRYPATFRTATSAGTSTSPSFSVPTGTVIY